MKKKSANLLGVVKSHREEILVEARKVGAQNVRLFGSVVQGKDGVKSDIDLVVKFKEKTLDAYMDFKMSLEKMLKRKVDLVMEDAIKPRLRKKILAEAINVERL